MAVNVPLCRSGTACSKVVGFTSGLLVLLQVACPPAGIER